MSSKSIRIFIITIATSTLLAFVWLQSLPNDNQVREPQMVTLRSPFLLGATQWHSMSFDAMFSMVNPTDYSNSNQGQPVRAQVSADMFSKVLEVNAQDSWLGVQFLNVKCPSEVLQNPECAAVYGTPFLLNISAQGEINEFIFPNDLAKEEEKKLTSLIEPLSISAEVATNSSVDVSDQDELGTALVRYEKKNNSITKTKLDYLTLNDHSGYVDQAQIEKGSAALKISESGWFESFLNQEKVSLTQAGKKQFHYELDLRYQEIASKSADPDWASNSLALIRNSFASQVKRPQSRRDEFLKISQRQSYQNNKFSVESSILKLSDEMSPATRLSVLGEIADYLKAFPERTSEIINLITSTSSSDWVKRDLFYALQSSGTLEAQQALVTLANDPNLDLENQKRAIVALGFVPLESESVNSLWKIAENQSSDEFRARAQVALFSLGSAVEPISGQSPELADGILKKIEAKLRSAAEANNYSETENLLLALGNSRDDRAAERISVFLQSESDRLRLSAAQALEISAKSEFAFPLAAQLLEEQSPAVREALVDSLLKIDITEESYAAAVQAYLEEDSNAVRMKLAKYFIAASEKFPESRSTIAELMPNETEPNIFELLARASIGSK